ncbi:hypothetical protein SMACR_00225 [Sordaria macrospora]|uniref:WGS project CABT00000000 data, contig 2.1 n=2 Tax=Sordaria macrospora TaxID=5147 RepID=F7VKI2_SORMK|nr:uncharacterized protein SMAC_00225 [Sordaria macrospora k-hell]KAA8636798.1 hypothetical protein SMACR_00225 [Sordaria macrospora]KAH7634228.1 hypothetical protein B0T09DRAFT_404481 [Sordaria sp. MPI-SDFR-AT-0083]WPJ58969.1 hypothetical protein SMAC4_00225 [Sordaria macrospora]CCC06009.1 unnamed protein product [Sordaria macrospora k-hell]
MAKKNKNGGGPPRIVGDFSRYFGEDTLENWQRLCRDIGINKDLPNIKTCKKILRGVHVNIFDLLEAVQKGTQPKRFRNADQLAEYSVANRKIYPRRYVKKESAGPVRVLLRLFF